ncbi:hypothetical protein [Alicyclobacillus macrosporangiidus]|uniref:Uncharacterized protein n=1 Tax=Alicyclobacillus macrosporangiidus TaxID=392015 RepID=A0A1I7IBP3_9BACL|nr:hypothetical protein [Alicyclobacillus macrosporangiidus]SFU70354.1 hypothetical protein SAMN05421543_106117 [Alicyclobacillus macrosporangiidus]
MIYVGHRGDLSTLYVDREVWHQKYHGQPELTEQYAQRVCDFLMDHLPASVFKRLAKKVQEEAKHL